MSINHDYPQEEMTKKERDKLDELLSDTLQLYFDLKKRDVEQCESVLMKGTDID